MLHIALDCIVLDSVLAKMPDEISNTGIFTVALVFSFSFKNFIKKKFFRVS